MKRVIIFMCFILSGVLNAQDLLNIANAERESAKPRIVSETSESGLNIDVKWYRCFWNIDPSVRQISGNVTTLFTALQQGIDSVAFDLSVAMSVDSVIYHNARVNWYHVLDVITL